MSAEKMNGAQEQEPTPKMLVLKGLHHNGGGDYLDVQGITMLEILFGHEPNPGYFEGAREVYRQIQFKDKEEIRALAEQHGFLFVSDPNVTDNSVWSDEVKHMVWAPPTRKFYRFLKEEHGPVILGGITLQAVDAREPDKRSFLDMIDKNEHSPFHPVMEEDKKDRPFYKFLIEDTLHITPSVLEQWGDFIKTRVSFINQLVLENKGGAPATFYFLNTVMNLFTEEQDRMQAKEMLQKYPMLKEENSGLVIEYGVLYVLCDFIEKYFDEHVSKRFEVLASRIMNEYYDRDPSAYHVSIQRALRTPMSTVLELNEN